MQVYDLESYVTWDEPLRPCTPLSSAIARYLSIQVFCLDLERSKSHLSTRAILPNPGLQRHIIYRP